MSSQLSNTKIINNLARNNQAQYPVQPRIGINDDSSFKNLEEQCSIDQSKKERASSIMLIQGDHKKTSVQLRRQSLWNNPFKSRVTKKEGFNDTWRKGSLRIIYFITKFISSLQQGTDQIKFKFLTQNVFGLINDNCADYNFYFFRGMLKSKPSQLKIQLRILNQMYNSLIPCKFMNYIKVIQPDSYFKLLWDTLVLLVIIVNIFYLPFQLAFQVDAYTILFEDLPSYIFLFEIILNFNTAFYEQGRIHTERKAIFLNYLKGDFIIDFIVIVPFFISRYEIPYINFALLLRVTRVNALFQNIEEVLNLREKFSAIIDLMKLIYFVIFVGHFCACAWYFLGIYEVNSGHYSWIIEYKVLTVSNFEKYIYSLYWSNITLLTVGYGDIGPVTHLERIFVIIVALITCGVFGYAINNIGSIFKEMDEKREKFKNQMAAVNSYLKKHEIAQSLQLQVRKYFEFYFIRKEEEDNSINTLMHELPEELKMNVMVDLYKRVLKLSKFLRENLSDECLNQICVKVKEKKYSPEEVLFERNELQKKMFFIINGTVKILDNTLQSKKIIRTFKENYVIGERNFLLNKNSDYKAIAGDSCSIIYIDYGDFINTLYEFPQDYEKYSMLKDNLQLNPNYKKIFTVCEICKSNHYFQKCPFTFFHANKFKILQQLNISTQHGRIYFHREKDRIKKHELAHIQQAALAVSLNENILEEDDLNDNLLRNLGLIQQSYQENEMPQQDDDTIKQSQSSNFSHEQNSQRRRSDLRKSLYYQKMPSALKRFAEKSGELMDQASKSKYSSMASVVSNRSNNLAKERKSMILEDQMPLLDQYKQYQYYFPIYNIQQVLARIEQHQIKKTNRSENLIQLKNQLATIKKKRLV